MAEQEKQIVVTLDVMLAKRKMRSKELAERIGITEQNLSLLKSGKVKGVHHQAWKVWGPILLCRQYFKANRINYRFHLLTFFYQLNYSVV